MALSAPAETMVAAGVERVCRRSGDNHAERGLGGCAPRTGFIAAWREDGVRIERGLEGFERVPVCIRSHEVNPFDSWI